VLLHGRVLEPEPFRAALRDPALKPGRLFRAHFDLAQFHEALARTTDAGPLDDVVACALADAVLQVGADVGSLDVDGDWVEHFVAIASAVLGDAALATKLLRGGWLGRVPEGAFAFGSLPLRVIARQVTRAAVKAARELVLYGWDSELINLLESAAMRAEKEPEHHLLLVGATVPLHEVKSASSRLFDLRRVLREAQDANAFEVMFQPDRPVLARTREGLSSMEVETTRGLVEAIAREFDVSMEETIVATRQVLDLGLVRVTASHGGVVVRLIEPIRAVDATLAQLLTLHAGLVVIGGPPASGRSSTLAALTHAWNAQGRVIATLAEPLELPASAFAYHAGQHHEFLRAVRLSPAQVIAVDLVDDAAGLELALELSLDGRLVLCTARGVALPAVVHRVALLDTKMHRRRVAEHLAAVVMTPGTTVFTPSVALRRHLRGNDTPPPPILFEPSDSSSK
jgi:hypothetical protein